MRKYLLFIYLFSIICFKTYADNLTFNEIDLEMIQCPKGRFMMGSPNDELGRNNDEEAHIVTLTKPFYIGKYEITQSQYEKIIGKNPSKFEGNNKPVDSITYDEAIEFCYRLNAKYLHSLPKGYRFDLPTEAQWEYACRAGNGSALNSGKEIMTVDGNCPNLDETAWYGMNSGYTTHEVGKKKPNAWGIYDMHGNVSEWCRDWFDPYLYNTDPFDDVSSRKRLLSQAIQRKEINLSRVYRGGCWSDIARNCRSARRFSNSPSYMYNFLGFRVALVPID